MWLRCNYICFYKYTYLLDCKNVSKLHSCMNSMDTSQIPVKILCFPLVFQTSLMVSDLTSHSLLFLALSCCDRLHNILI